MVMKSDVLLPKSLEVFEAGMLAARVQYGDVAGVECRRLLIADVVEAFVEQEGLSSSSQASELRAIARLVLEAADDC